MSYSRWIGSHWYTYWCVRSEDTPENRDNATFEICGVTSFTAKELREELENCMYKVRKLDPEGDIVELQGYINEFLRDVDAQYPEKDASAAPIFVVFRGIDGFNRPVFKELGKKRNYYGCTHELFDWWDEEEAVLEKITEDHLTFFGNSFGCEPEGTPAPNLKILTREQAKQKGYKL